MRPLTNSLTRPSPETRRTPSYLSGSWVIAISFAFAKVHTNAKNTSIFCYLQITLNTRELKKRENTLIEDLLCVTFSSVWIEDYSHPLYTHIVCLSLKRRKEYTELNNVTTLGVMYITIVFNCFIHDIEPLGCLFFYLLRIWSIEHLTKKWFATFSNIDHGILR